MEENKYSRGKIYKLVAKHYEGESLTYFGSTCEPYLSTRLGKHKCDYKNYLEGKRRYITSFKIFEEYNINNVDIILVEDFPCENKYQLESRERYYIENNLCVNKHIPTRTNKEHYEANKEIIQEKRKDYNINYRLENNEIIKSRAKIYREENKEKLKVIKKSYRDEHKDDAKKYREDNKEKLNNYFKELYENKEIYNCECGGIYNSRNKTTHFKTKKHINY